MAVQLPLLRVVSYRINCVGTFRVISVNQATWANKHRLRGLTCIIRQ